MRVLLITWEYPPVIEGGLGRHVFALSQALARAGHEVCVLTRGAPAEERCGQVEVRRVALAPFPGDLDAFMAWVTELNAVLGSRGAEWLAEGDVDVIHSHDWLVAAAARDLAATAGVPWVVTVHATEFGRHHGWVDTHPQRDIHLTERRMVRAADRVICCSAHMGGHVRRVFGVDSGRMSVIPNAIDAVPVGGPGRDVADRVPSVRPSRGADVGRTALRARYAAPEQPLVLLLGRLVHEKGFHVALEALARLENVHFVLAGDGPKRAALRDRVRALGLSARGTLAGRIDDGLLRTLFDVVDVMAVPSLYEPFGIVALEAMAAGCPLVVSDTGGLAEVVADSPAALRVAPGDAAALAAALERVLTDVPLRERMRRAGPAHAATFDWDTVAASTASAYEAARTTFRMPTPASTQTLLGLDRS